MLGEGVLLGAGLLWLGLLFGTALWGEHRAAALERYWAVVYALSLAVYCTSWTFFGTVTQVLQSGWWLPPTFIGTIGLYLFAIGALRRVVAVASAQGATSIADLIAGRLGKDTHLAAVVTAVVLVGMIPYIALQLKAVAMGHRLLSGSPSSAAPSTDGAFYVALALALFAMLFGTRKVSAVEHNRGLVLAMAVESLFKLGAMLTLGAFVVFGIAPLPTPAPRIVNSDGFAPLIALGVLAMVTLPHQFHVGVVECQDQRHLHTARWLFPLYLVLIALPILPLARAGEALLSAQAIPSDLYVLALPIHQGRPELGLLAFLGGLSAAAGMVIMATLAVSLMIGNHWITPLLLRRHWTQHTPDMRAHVLWQRRAVILLVLLIAWGYSRLIAVNDALADMGASSFSALATLAPGLVIAIWRPQTPARAVSAGLIVGLLVWFWILPLPTLMDAAGIKDGLLARGPFVFTWLRPDGFLGLHGWSPLGRAVGASLAFTVAVTAWVAWRTPASETPVERVPAQAKLRAIAGRLLSRDLVERLAAESLGDSKQFAIKVERELANVLGAASTRLLFDAVRREASTDLETVAAIVSEASQVLRFNQQILEAALENMSQGISVVDHDLRLVAWNRRYAELFGFPETLLQVGRPIADLTAFALRRLAPPEADLTAMVARRLAWMRRGTAHLSERVFPDGSVIEIRGNPMPSGGFVATFTDVTAFRRAESALRQANETLERRVLERTEALARASAQAQAANAAKSRFLAAVGHDLVQPLHAAQLFTHALREGAHDPALQEPLAHIGNALASTESLLSGLLDLSRLEAGRLTVERRVFALAECIDPLTAEFAALAAERGMRLRRRTFDCWVESDPALLRRILQNFLANALRFGKPGGNVLLSARRRGAQCELQVWDDGVGIAAEDRERIFEEFQRGSAVRGLGLGLGLSIARRIAILLEHPLSLHSQPGRGSVFGIRVPLATAAPVPAAPDAVRAERMENPQLTGTVLVVDNDPQVLLGMRALLERWGMVCQTAHDLKSAEHCLGGGALPDVLILDFHLDAQATGPDLWIELTHRYGSLPAMVISADRSPEVRECCVRRQLPLLYKPIKPLALRASLQRLLQAARG